jgi:HEAT repeat protein
MCSNTSVADSEIRVILDRAIAEAAEAERDGVPARLDQGAIGLICELGYWWPTGDGRIAEHMIRDLRDPAAIPLLLALIERRDEMPSWYIQHVPSWCAAAAAAIPDDRTLTALLGVMADSDDTDLVAWIIDGLGARGDDRASEGLRRVMTEPRPGWDGRCQWLALKAAAALAELGDRSGLSIVVNALDDDWPPTRSLAIEPLVLLRPHNIVELLGPALQDPEMKILAINALAEVATPQAIETLISLTDDPDWEIAERCTYFVAHLVGLPIDHDTGELPDRAQLTAAWRQAQPH